MTHAAVPTRASALKPIPYLSIIDVAISSGGDRGEHTQGFPSLHADCTAYCPAWYHRASLHTTDYGYTWQHLHCL